MHQAAAMQRAPLVQGLLQRIEHEARMRGPRHAPGLRPVSRSAFFTHSFSVWPVQPILAAIDRIVA
jgi:hypothetical protein